MNSHLSFSALLAKRKLSSGERYPQDANHFLCCPGRRGAIVQTARKSPKPFKIRGDSRSIGRGIHTLEAQGTTGDVMERGPTHPHRSLAGRISRFPVLSPHVRTCQETWNSFWHKGTKASMLKPYRATEHLCCLCSDFVTLRQWLAS